MASKRSERRAGGERPVRPRARTLAALGLLGVVLAIATSIGLSPLPSSAGGPTTTTTAPATTTTAAETTTTAAETTTTEATTTTTAAPAEDSATEDEDTGIPDGVLFALEAAVVIGAIVMGTKSSGVALGIWGGVGVAVLVFVFGLAPGSPPIDAILIILSVILAAATMQVAGGIDWMVVQAANAIRSRPKQVTLIAPLMSFLFCLGAGTGNIVYPLLPVIYDVSYRQRIRPERPLAMTVVVSGIALACSPVSAAMAAMITLTDVEPYNFSMVDVLKVTIPAALIGIFLTSIVMNRKGKELQDDPEFQARVADGRLATMSESEGDELTYTKEGRNAAFIFLAGVLTIVVFGLFPDIRPQIPGEDGSLEPIGVTPIIQMAMFVVAALILLLCKPESKQITESSVFKAGIISAVALFGLAWLTDTFIAEWETQIVDTVGGWVTDYQSVFFFGVFLVAALTTSQSTATRTIVPIGLAVGLSPAVVSAMWAGGFAGVFTLPTNGSQIAAANFDQTGTTKLGTKLVDHSFIVPVLVLGATVAIPGVIIANLLY
jgi:anaerobic C4-dicarboxylate transporter DcuA/anaerobic C4-dicarboxylate transporter DcuB